MENHNLVVGKKYDVGGYGTIGTFVNRGNGIIYFKIEGDHGYIEDNGLVPFNEGGNYYTEIGTCPECGTKYE